MKLRKLVEKVQSYGVVGAGGAGFPTYAKFDERAEILCLNCAECEPLLSLHRQLLERHADEILRTFALLVDAVGASEGVIGIKGEYKAAINAVEAQIARYPKLRIHRLNNVYPMGDEVVLIYEATGRRVRPGGLPIEVGVAVFNVETVYNICRGLEENVPVVDKLISVVGEVARPQTVRAPLGTRLSEVVDKAGGITADQPVYLVGGPMMGRFGAPDDPVTKTTNAILVLPKDHALVRQMSTKPSISLKRAASVCCQCQMCTDLCPRHALGHPIEPHLFMRSAANADFQNVHPFLNTFFCSGCGTCELYACPQGLAPRTLITNYKNGLRSAGVKAPEASAGEIHESREYRKVPEERLAARLGLSRYETEAPLDDAVIEVGQVSERLSQHIGAPAVPVVAVGEAVVRGQVIARAAEGLSVPIHASIDGDVAAVSAMEISIRRR